MFKNSSKIKTQIPDTILKKICFYLKKKYYIWLTSLGNQLQIYKLNNYET